MAGYSAVAPYTLQEFPAIAFVKIELELDRLVKEGTKVSWLLRRIDVDFCLESLPRLLENGGMCL